MTGGAENQAGLGGQADQIDLVVAVDAITHPLTGIGRYAYELLRRVQQDPAVGAIRYFSLGRWVKDPCPQVLASSAGSAPLASTGPTLRARLAKNSLAVAAYGWVSPPLFRWRMRNMKHAVFHAPNFFVPAFPGGTVSTVHDLSHLIAPDCHPQARVRYMIGALQSSLTHTDYIVTDSEAVRSEIMERLAWPADRVVAIHPGVGDEFNPVALNESTLSTFGLAADAYALFVGTIEPRKNVDRLIDAYAALPVALRRDWPLVIVGTMGWKSEHTQARMAAAEAEGWLKYLRYVPQQVLPRLYAGARLFVYPSLYEGFGLPILEAMASGVPVITSNRSSMPEVASGVARLIDPLDVEALRDAIETGLSDQAWRTQARDAGLRRAATFSWTDCAAQTVEVYRKARDRKR